MRKGWKEIKFGEIATFKNGLNYSRLNHGQGCKIISVSNFKNRFKPDYETLDEINPEGLVKKRDYLNSGDILFVRSNGNKNLVGRSLYIENDTNIVYSGFCIRARVTGKDICPLFYAYYCRTKSFRNEMSSISGGTNITNLNQKILERSKVPFPPLSIQKKIASTLSAYDDLIENNLRRIKLLEEQAQLMYEEWFVRMRFPGFEELGIDAGTGLPVGWEKEYFKNTLSFKTGKLDSNALVENGKYNFYTCAKSVLKTDTYCFEGEAVLLGGNNATGDFALFYANEKFDAYQRTYIVNSLIDDIPLVYVYYYFKMLLPYFQIVSSGASTKFLTMKILNKTKILVPDLELLKKYSDFVKPSFDLVVKLKRKNLLLQEARDIMLPRLMTGLVDVEGI